MLAFAPCKINLGLNVLRRRDDGYHDIDTVMVPVPWCDIVEIVPAAVAEGEDTLTVSGYKVDCPPEKNLVMKAVRAIRCIANFPAVDVYLHKNVPDGAGLGGGSSDAATAAKLVNEIFGLDLTSEQLRVAVATVGSDCPFFIDAIPARCTGRGTEIQTFALPSLPRYILIAKPCGCSVSTAQAYAGVQPDIPEYPIPEVLTRPVWEWRELLVNDFESSVFAIAPELAALKKKIYSLGAEYAAMSGSGAAIFGLFNEKPEFDTEMFKGMHLFVSQLNVNA